MSKPGIHPTALVAHSARLGNNITIGPYAVIGEQVEIGDDCHIGAHAVLHDRVRMGGRNRVHPHAVLGGLPQDISFDPKRVTGVVIGDDNEFREGVTINRATVEGADTRVGSGCYLMNNAHIAHDCVVGDRNIFASSATLGGHVRVGDRVFFGGGAMVHQFCRIGTLVMVAGVIGIRKDVIPFTLVGGQPVRHYRLNLVGIRRAGIAREGQVALSTAFRRLRDKQGLADLTATAEISYLRDWLAAPSKRGLYGFVDARGGRGGDDD